MGGFGQSTATVGNQVTNSKTTTAAEKAAAAKTLADQYGLNDKDPPPPSLAVDDLGDELLRKAGIDSKTRGQSKQGRKQSFLTGAMGDVTEPIISEKKAIGKY